MPVPELASSDPDSGRARPSRAAVVACAVPVACVAAFIVYAGRGETFFFDEWSFLIGRQGHEPSTFLEAYNGNCSVFALLLFKSLIELVGTDDYWVLRIVLLGLHLSVVGLVFVLARPRVGTLGGGVAGTLVLVMGASADNLLWPAQFGYLLSIIGGLIALVAIDRASVEHSDRRVTILAILAGGALVLSLGSSSTGAPFWLLAAIEFLAMPVLRRRLWAVATPLLLYLLWTAAYGDNQIRGENVGLAFEFVAKMAATAVAGAFGLTSEWGPALLVLAIAGLVIWRLRGGIASVRLVAALAALLALWVLTALARASIEQPEAPRFVYVGVILMLLVAAEVLRGRRLRPNPLAACAGILLLVAVVLGLRGVQQRGRELRDDATALKARLAAVEIAGPRVPDDFVVSPRQVQIYAGPAIEVQRRHGRIAFTVAQLRAARNEDRQQADLVLTALASLGVRTRSQPGAPRAGSCTRSEAGTPLEVERAPGTAVTVTSRAGTRLDLWRFADGPGAIAPVRLASGRSLVSLAGDSDPRDEWHLRFRGDAPLRACTRP